MTLPETPRSLIRNWKQRARQLKAEIYALYLAYRDPRTPWYARIFVAIVIGYAFSPIDLIPDFIPLVGYLDDLVLIPLGIWLSLKMIPTQVISESRILAQDIIQREKPVNQTAGLIIIAIWICLVTLAIALFSRSVLGLQVPTASWFVLGAGLIVSVIIIHLLFKKKF